MDELLPNSRNYRKLIRDVLRMYAFLNEGKFDSEEADELREDMERPWMLLGEEEQCRIQGLSLDLKRGTGAMAGIARIGCP